MSEAIDWEIWAGLLALTAILYLLKWVQSRRKTKVYRVSADSLKRSQQVLLLVLPLVEDGDDSLIDESRLPYPKENVKSAAKILAYYYWKENRLEELSRVKNCFIALSRFQRDDLDEDLRQKQAEREEAKLVREYECYLTHSPFKSSVQKTDRAA